MVKIQSLVSAKMNFKVQSKQLRVTYQKTVTLELPLDLANTG